MISETIKNWLDKVDDDIKQEMMTGYRVSEDGLPVGWVATLKKQYGGEGQGDDIWAVWSFEHPNHETFFIKLHGHYASYYGGEYSGYHEVTPKTETVTNYV